MTGHQSQDLRRQMIINKARRPNHTITAKSLLTLAITWSLWLYALYYLSHRYEEVLLNRPFIADWTFKDVLVGVTVILLVQLNILLLWSIFVRTRIKSKERQSERQREDAKVAKQRLQNKEQETETADD